MVSLSRKIIHVDMDAFYASVEQRDCPGLRGKPIAVGGRPEKRGVVAAASYEARNFGVHSALSMTKALRLCPSLIIVPPNFLKYRAISRQVFDLFRMVTPIVEPLSLDEAYLDVTNNSWDEPLATTVAKRLKARIFEKTGLTASAGVAPNKFLAKIASGWRKPDGLTVVAHEHIEPFLRKLPVDALWGIGPITGRKLRAAGIERLTDVRNVSDIVLRSVVGNKADQLRCLSRGVDDRPVISNRATKSHSTERTYAKDLNNLETIQKEIDRMARVSGKWLESNKIYARTVTIKVRYDNFRTVTRSDTASVATNSGEDVARRGQMLLERTDTAHRPVRLLGVGVHGLMATETGRRNTKHPLLWDTAMGI